MSWSYWKKLPTPVLWLVRPALFLSLGLHALLLLLPLLPDRPSEPTEAEPEETEVTLTPLPIEPTPKAIPVPSPTPSATASPVPLPAAPTPAPVRPSVPNFNTAPSPTTPSQPAPAASPSPTATSTLVPTQPATQTTTPAPPSPSPQNRVVAPFASFPHLAQAQPGCFNQAAGDCRQVSGNFRQVSQALTDQLSQQGYAVKQRDDLEETGRQVYEVTKDGATRYLSVISSDLSGTAYILADEPVTQTDIEQVGTVQTELQTLLSNLASGNTATPSQFAYPESFFTGTQPRPEMSSPLYLINGTAPPQFVDRLTSTLQTSGFKAAQIGEFGGGALYEVGKKAFLGYVNLVPTQDGAGTIVVLWQSIPQ